ncbi:MAG: glycosyltransferase family 61 protein [Endomicrobia bacterium]|nr:glycosyltransferase family 61 protein [Endomicrobiia bacterium]MCL2507337.1 glycosyltransferase family 61 protein [Endomicrobiia bacterium]
MNKVYASDSFKKLFNEYVLKVKEEDRNLKTEVYNNAFILPFRNSTNGAEINDEGGVFDSDGNIIDLSKTRKSKYQVKVGSPLHYAFNSKTIYINEDVVFLGYFSTHFGHFLLESLNRLWFVLNSDVLNKKFVYIGESDVYFIEILELLGLNKNNIIRITKPTKFKSITVPEESNRIEETFYNKKYKEIFKRVRDNIVGLEYDKIYLSRTKFKRKDGTVAGEQEIERMFENNGFKIIYPERFSIKEQLRLVKNCKHLAGIQGTAIHLSLFAEDGVKLTVIHRTKDDIFPEQIKINNMKNIDSSHIEADLDFLRPFPLDAAFAISIRNKYMKQWLNENHYKFDTVEDNPVSLEQYISPKEFKYWSKTSKLKNKIKDRLIMFLINFIFIKSLRKRMRYKFLSR